MTETERSEIKFEIVEHIGIIKPIQTGWNKELNVVAWNGKQAKYDIREWDPTHERMSKGITLHRDEMKKVLSLMEGREI